MEIVFKKGDVHHHISCLRSDGSSTWMQAQTFMVIHDLTHYAVETSLSFDMSFYGLVAGGLDITDFENKQKFKPREMPAQAGYAEIIVNLLLTEMSDGHEIEDFNGTMEETNARLGLPPFRLEEKKLAEIRIQIVELINKWRNLKVGERMSLSFPPT